MVKHWCLMAILFMAAMALAGTSYVNAQNIIYRVDHEWAQIYINQDGTIDLTYNLTLTVSSGVIHSIDIGQPNGDFTRGTAVDQYGNQLTTTDDSSGNNYLILVTLNQPLTAGNTIWLTLTSNVGKIIFNDTTNPGNLGMQFAPQWMTDSVVSDVRIQIILPPNVTLNDVKTTQVFYNATSIVEGRLAVYWEKPSLQPNEKYLVGVSFPAQALPDYNPGQSSGIGDLASYLLVIALGVAAIFIVGFIVVLARKSSYSSPKISMETLGTKRGLTAVEASYLLELKPTQIVTEIVYSLLKKRAIWVEASKPSLKFRLLPPFDDKVGPQDSPLQYYEIDLLNSLKKDGSLDEEKLAHTVMFVEATVEQKLRGYSRKDTMDYYRRIVAQAWTQVEQAGTVELTSNAYDEQLLWLLLDPNQRSRTQSVFHDRVFQPNPIWLWYWYGYSQYHPNPVYKPNIETLTQSGKPPSIPGAEFANNIATSVENTSNAIVANLEKFANAIVPSQTAKTSHNPARHGADCVCACHACACACACVSCACACAGGGAH
jgi:hypothetical protein